MAGSESITVAGHYVLRPGVTVTSFDSSNRHLTHQVAGAGVRVAVCRNTALLMSFLSSPRTVEEIATFILEKGLPVAVPGGLLRYLEGGRLSSFIQFGSSGASLGTSPVGVSHLTFRRELLSPSTAERIARNCTCLFSRIAAIGLLACIMISHIWYLHRHGLWHGDLSSHKFRLELLLAVIVSYVGVLFHEIGHCAAALRFGVKPGGIGFGLYLLWPVLYTDISRGWELNRWHRVIVDLSGMYFQLVFSTACIVVALFTHFAWLQLVVDSVVLSLLTNCNPFLRFDGFWVLTDACGVPNVSGVIKELWKRFISRIGLMSTLPCDSRVLEIPLAVRIVLAGYSLVSAIFIAWLCFNTSERLTLALCGLPHRVVEMMFALRHSKDALQAIRAIIAPLLFCGLLSNGLYSLGRRCRKKVCGLVRYVRSRRVHSAMQG
jgi:putative peptide zinc metalloprotease protein